MTALSHDKTPNHRSLGGSPFRFGSGLSTHLELANRIPLLPYASLYVGSPFKGSFSEASVGRPFGVQESPPPIRKASKPWFLPKIPATGKKITQQMIDDVLEEQ